MNYNKAVKQLKSMKPFEINNYDERKVKLYSESQIFVLLDVIMNSKN